MLDKSEKYSNKIPLNPIQKTGFWFLVSSIILGIPYLYIEYLRTKSWDSYWEVAAEIDNDFLYYIVTNDIYLILILLGFIFLYLGKKRSLRDQYISFSVTLIFVFDRVFYYFGIWDENEFYRNYSFIILIVFYAFLGVIIWKYYRKTAKNKIPLYLYLYSVVSFLLLIINAYIISLGIKDNTFKFMYFSAMVTLLVAVIAEIYFLMKDHIIINVYTRGEEKMGVYNNRISNIILTTGKTYIVLSIIGAFFLIGFLEDYDTTIKFTIIVVGLVYTFVFSLIFFGAAEIIELLHQQNKNTEELIRIQKNSSQQNESSRRRPMLEDFEDLPEL